MKTKLLLRLSLIFVWIAVAFACKNTDLAPSETVSTEAEHSSIMPFADTEKPSERKSDGEEKAQSVTSKVWVCKSSGATKYHYNRDCGGLKRCSHEIDSSTVRDAEAVGLGQCSLKKCQ